MVEELNDKETYCIPGCYSSGLITSSSRTSIGSTTAGDPDTHSSFKDSESHKLNQHSERGEVYWYDCILLSELQLQHLGSTGGFSNNHSDIQITVNSKRPVRK